LKKQTYHCYLKFKLSIWIDKKLLPGLNSFADIHEELLDEWSPNNNYKPTEILFSRKVNVVWICPTCNGEYPYVLSDRYLGDDSCPYCKENKIFPGFNSFKINHKELIEEWSYVNNYLIIDPDTISDNYQLDVWWKCKTCNYSYKMSPKQQVLNQKRHKISCQFCKGYRRKRSHFF